MGFCEEWIALIMRCITSVKYRVVTNEAKWEEFRPTRGLRQGDPLSPYLFLICAEGFSHLIERANRDGRPLGARVGRSNISVTHLFFADDSILFGEASTERVNTIKGVIKEYEVVSGQKVNFEKLFIYFSGNVEAELKEQVGSTLGVRISNNPEKYLGLPTMVGRRKKQAFNEIRDRFNRLVNNWSIRFLLIGGRERSIWEARSLLEEGVGWRIRNGRSVNIWNDAWIPGAGNGRIQCQQMDIKYSNVSDLIEDGSVTWKQEEMRALFGEDQMQRIVSILLESSESQDVLIWRGRI
ncbi:hypothetical protein J1N35_018159 [Gossypium stocksii]|uniref:Reverse transcriptase domain-containing protein n=1 Tax=Gossypium stocksii TaxID=47602 RepID=A0A9D3VPH5_9ROSI|nr:hypothetical protein J1N35_018159 [Gossypium stocksii]